jgi:uncharacterized protein DUF6644
MFDWLADTSIAHAVGDSVAVFATVEGLHILSIALLCGCVLLAGLAGLELEFRAAAGGIEHGLRIPFRMALMAAAITGVLLFSTSPQKYLTNPLFGIKLGLLVLALAVQAYRVWRLRRCGSDGRARALAGISLFLWLGVVTAGRWIGLV